MPIQSISLFSQKITKKELNYFKKAVKFSEFSPDITLLHEHLKSLEVHCQQFKKLHVEWKSLNNSLDQKIKYLSSQKKIIPQFLPNNQPEKPSSTLIPYVGLGLGTLTGLIERQISSRPFDFADKKLAKEIFKQLPLLDKVNLWKQLEIKHFSLAMPLLPLAAQVIQATAKGPKDQHIAQRFKTALRTCSTIEQRVYLLAAIAGMIGVYCYPKEWAEKHFDPSGHIMLKTLLTTLTAKTLSTTLKSAQNRAAILGSSALYAITDAVLIHTTVSVCHTVPELAAGFAAAWTISALAKKAIGMLQPVKL